MEKRIEVLLLLWAGLSVPTLRDTVAGVETVSAYFGWVGPSYQPLVRALHGKLALEAGRDARRAPAG